MTDCLGRKIYHKTKVRFVDEDMCLDFVGRLYRRFDGQNMVLVLDIPDSECKLVFEDDGFPCFQLFRVD